MSDRLAVMNEQSNVSCNKQKTYLSLSNCLKMRIISVLTPYSRVLSSNAGCLHPPVNYCLTMLYKLDDQACSWLEVFNEP